MDKNPNHYFHKKLPVMEIFGPTIQGEGYLAGAQTHFVRFGGCDYKCKMCDSIHAIDPEYIHKHATWLPQHEIGRAVELLQPDREDRCPWVTLSGGNPAIHELSYLVNHLNTEGYRVAVETQGTLAPDWLSAVDCLTVSPKSPGMGEKFEPDKFEDFLIKFQYMHGLNVKVVVFKEEDLDFAGTVYEQAQRYLVPDRFYLSLGNPVVPVLTNGVLHSLAEPDEHKIALLHKYAELVELIVQDHRLSNARFFPQLHVLAWSNQQGR